MDFGPTLRRLHNINFVCIYECAFWRGKRYLNLSSGHKNSCCYPRSRDAASIAVCPVYGSDVNVVWPANRPFDSNALHGQLLTSGVEDPLGEDRNGSFVVDDFLIGDGD